MTMVIMNMEFRDEKQIINLSAPKAGSLNATLYDRYLELKRDNFSSQINSQDMLSRGKITIT